MKLYLLHRWKLFLRDCHFSKVYIAIKYQVILEDNSNNGKYHIGCKFVTQNYVTLVERTPLEKILGFIH